MRSTSLTLTLAAVMAFTSSCATTGGAPTTAMNRAKGQCAAAVVVGALAGAIIGNNTGSGNSRRGALVGLGAGVGICAILLAMASEEDQRRLAELESEALEAGQRRENSYVGTDGRRRSIVVQASAVDDPLWNSTPSATDSAQPTGAATSVERICRRKQVTLTVETMGTGTLDEEIVCRNPLTRAWEVQRV